MYQAHYRNTLDISNDALLAAEKGFEKIKSLNKDINEILSNKTNDFNVMDWVNDCYQTLNDDFNSPKLIAKLFELHKVVSEIKSSRKNIDSKNLILLKKYFKVFYDEILGLNKNYSKDDNQNELLKLILELRKKERDNKNFDASDYIRDRLIELGINVSDK